MTLNREKLRQIAKEAGFSLSGAYGEPLEKFASLVLSAAQEEREPVAPHIIEALSYHARERDDLTLDEALDYLRHGWKKVCGRSERELVLQITALLAGATVPPSSDQVWNEAIEAAVQKCERRLHRQFNKTIHAVTSCMNAIRSLKRPSQAQEPTNGELLRAIQGTIPLVEPVHITKALRAGRKAQVCLSGGTGPLACVMLVNIQLTPWIHSEDTAKAFADGYNRALEQHRAALLELIKNFEAQPSASGVVGEQSAFPERDSSKPTEHQGIFRKFDVRRVDGSDQPGGKHYGCRYFVLDLNHDAHAPAAMLAYAAACKTTHPQLAADIEVEFGEQPAAQTEVPEGFVLAQYPITNCPQVYHAIVRKLAAPSSKATSVPDGRRCTCGIAGDGWCCCGSAPSPQGGDK